MKSVKEYKNKIKAMVNMDLEQVKERFIESTQKYKIHKSKADRWLDEYKELEYDEKYLFWFILDGFHAGNVGHALREVIGL